MSEDNCGLIVAVLIFSLQGKKMEAIKRKKTIISNGNPMINVIFKKFPSYIIYYESLETVNV